MFLTIKLLFSFKLHTYAKLNCLKWNCFWHWNCAYALTELFNVEEFWYLTVYKQNLCLYYTELVEFELLDETELVEIEMFLTIKLCTY